MPQLSGLDLAHKVRALRPDLPVLLMSGYLLGVEAEELRTAGICLVVQKPFSVQGLADAMAQALRVSGAKGG